MTNVKIGDEVIKIELDVFNGQHEDADGWDFMCQNTFGAVGLDDVLDGTREEKLDPAEDKKLCFLFLSKMKGNAVNVMRNGGKPTTLSGAYLKFKKNYAPERTMNKFQTVRKLISTPFKGGDVEKHLRELEQTKETIESMKVTMDDILVVSALVSLPNTPYGELKTQAVLKDDLTMEKLHGMVQDFDAHRSMEQENESEMNEIVALKAELQQTKAVVDNLRRTNTTEHNTKAFQLKNPHLVCINPNCKKRGHTIENCWAKGGGKEGQIPEWILEQQKERKYKANFIFDKVFGVNDDQNLMKPDLGMQINENVKSKKSKFYFQKKIAVDSGATRHMFSTFDEFYSKQNGSYNIKYPKGHFIQGALGDAKQVDGKGNTENVFIQCANDDVMKC